MLHYHWRLSLMVDIALELRVTRHRANSTAFEDGSTDESSASLRILRVVTLAE